MVAQIQTFSFFPLLIPLPVRDLFSKYVLFRQNVYDRFTLYFLETKYISNYFQFYHKFLFFFRVQSSHFFFFVEKYIFFNHLVLILSLVLSRLHLAHYFILVISVFIFIELKTLPMLRFYKRYPSKLGFLYNNQQRHMWNQASKIAQEAASNPQVQGAIAAVGGLLVWKAMDVYDTQTQREISQADRIAQKEVSEADRIAQKEIAEADIKMRTLELEEIRLAREDENRRHAEDMEMRERELKNNKNEKQ
jgi:hypothetical protein